MLLLDNTWLVTVLKKNKKREIYLVRILEAESPRLNGPIGLAPGEGLLLYHSVTDGIMVGDRKQDVGETKLALFLTTPSHEN